MPGPTRKIPTIQDVARQAQVSAATVSRALSAPERVSESTRRRVTEAIRATGYTVNQAARSLRLRSARSILIALPNIGNPFYSTILDAVVVAAAERGYAVVVAEPFHGDRETWIAHYFSSNRVDGLLLFDGSVDTRIFHHLKAHGGRLPIVVSYDELPDPLVNAVMTDNLEAAGRAMGHLFAMGHRRIGHVTGHSRNAFPNERVLGYRNFVASHRLPQREDWVFPGDYTMQSGYAAGRAFAEMADRPSAVFCGNDEMAIGFISAIREAGLDCPRDVSLIGFDDINVAAHLSPPLTTMRQPRQEMGRRSTRMLIDILEGVRADRGAEQVVLKSDLIVRGSTAPLDAAPPARRGRRAALRVAP